MNDSAFCHASFDFWRLSIFVSRGRHVLDRPHSHLRANHRPASVVLADALNQNPLVRLVRLLACRLLDWSHSNHALEDLQNIGMAVLQQHVMTGHFPLISLHILGPLIYPRSVGLFMTRTFSPLFKKNQHFHHRDEAGVSNIPTSPRSRRSAAAHLFPH